MNAVEIERAVSALAEQPFDPEEFPYAFLEAFGNKATTIRRLRAGASNKSDIGGVLQNGNIHIAVAEHGQTAETLTALRESPATRHKRHRVRFILATDDLDREVHMRRQLAEPARRTTLRFGRHILTRPVFRHNPYCR